MTSFSEFEANSAKGARGHLLNLDEHTLAAAVDVNAQFDHP